MYIFRMSQLGLLPDKLSDWWKYCGVSLQSVSCSSGVKTWLYSSNFELQLGQSHLKQFDCVFVGPLCVLRFFCPGRRSFGCVSSIVVFLSEMLCLPTCLTG